MSEIIAEAIVDARTLKQYVDIYTPLVEEGRIHFNSDGLRTAILDPATVAAVNPGTLDASRFESLDVPGSVTIGLNFNRLNERIGPASGEDLIHLAVDMETRHLKIRYGNTEQSLGMIDPEAIQKEPDSPDIDLPNTVTLTGEDLDMVHTQSEMVSDHVEITALPDEKKVVFEARGDIDSSTVEFGPDDVADPTDLSEETTSMFSLSYLEDINKPIPSDSEVEIQFGDSFPMLMDWEACDGDIQVHHFLAPRVDSSF